MKKLLAASFVALLCFQHVHGQSTEYYITSDLTVNKSLTINSDCIIANGATLINKSHISINGTLYINGKLTNDGTITATNCVINNGEIFSTEYNKLLVNEQLHFSNARTASNDTTHIVTFEASETYIDDYTTMESAELTTGNLILNDTLEYTGKLGVKSVLHDFIINGKGFLLNTDNENIRLYGDAYNFSDIPCRKANFELFGLDNKIYGDFSCYRFDLSPEATYTNHGNLTVTETFPTSGKLIQAENATLTINTTTSPEIIANATGNTITFTRGGLQYLNVEECYNLTISKNGGNNLQLTRNTKITNSLTLNKKSFVDCDKFNLIFPNADESSIISSNSNGIILNNGTITFNNLADSKTIDIPIYSNDAKFCGVEITNLSQSPTNITIDSLFQFVTHQGHSRGTPYDFEFVNTTWHISSDCQAAEITFSWDDENELPFFDENNSNVYHFEQGKWINTEATTSGNTATAFFSADGYFSIGNDVIILPIHISNFSCTSYENYNKIYWTRESGFDKELELEKSIDGLHFFSLKNYKNSKEQLYEYEDFDVQTAKTIYYRLCETDKNGIQEYSSIICATSQNSDNIVISGNTLRYNSFDEPRSIKMYDLSGKLLCETRNNPLNINQIKQGIYILHIETENIEKIFKVTIHF